MIATSACRRTRRVALAALFACAPVALGGCVATVNFDAQTDQVYTPADGVNERSGEVDVLNALVVSEEPGSGRVIAGLANNNPSEPDELTGVRAVEESSELTVQLVEGDTEIPSGGLLQLADEEAAMITVSGDPEQLGPGHFVRLAFSFAEGGEVTVNVPVLAPGTDYADVELPSASPTADTGE